jgi:DNA-binding MarR family transcriptional regulator
VLNVRDKAKKVSTLAEPQRRYIDDLAQTLAHYGMTLTVGRLFGLLLVSDEPISLDDIAGQLGVSKSGASVAARDLERLGLVRRLATPGSRRIVYEATDTMEPVFESSVARIRDGLAMVQKGVPLLASGKARKRMKLMEELYQFWLGGMEDITNRWRRSRNAR